MQLLPGHISEAHAILCTPFNLATASQARPTSAAETAEPGRPPKLLLKLSLSNGSAGRGGAAAGQAGNRPIVPPPPAGSGPPAVMPKLAERKPVLENNQLGRSSDGITSAADGQPAGIAHVPPPSGAQLPVKLSEEDRAAAADWPALLAALRGWSEGRGGGNSQLPPVVRDPQVCVGLHNQAVQDQLSSDSECAAIAGLHGQRLLSQEER